MVQPAGNAARGEGGASKLSALQIRSRPGPALAAGQGDAGESSGRGVGDGALHGLRLGSYCCPPVGGKDDDGDVSPGEVLLKDKVLVAGDGLDPTVVSQGAIWEVTTWATQAVFTSPTLYRV
jgi:hypothetical protein